MRRNGFTNLTRTVAALLTGLLCAIQAMPLAARSQPTFSATAAEYSGATFSGTAVADTSNAGRYTMFTNPLIITAAASPLDFNMVIYQASGGQLIWMDEDTFGNSVGFLQQQGALTGLPAARNAAVKTKAKQKP
jgi:hypothetical protein